MNYKKIKNEGGYKMKKLSKIATTTAILMAMSTSAIAVSAQTTGLDTTKENQTEIVKQISNQDELTFKSEKDNLLLQADVCKMYADILIRINSYSSITEDLKAHIQEYNTQLDDLNKTIKENVDGKEYDANHTELENMQAMQKAQYDNLVQMSNILHNMDQYLDAIEG
jgi:cell division protein FtsL